MSRERTAAVVRRRSTTFVSKWGSTAERHLVGDDNLQSVW